MLTSPGRLPISKTFALDAFLYCSLRGIGVKIIGYIENSPIFKVFDFGVYFQVSKQISHFTKWEASKVARAKTLSRWFSNVNLTQLTTGITILTVKPHQIDRLNKLLTKARERCVLNAIVV